MSKKITGKRRCNKLLPCSKCCPGGGGWPTVRYSFSMTTVLGGHVISGGPYTLVPTWTCDGPTGLGTGGSHFCIIHSPLTCCATCGTCHYGLCFFKLPADPATQPCDTYYPLGCGPGGDWPTISTPGSVQGDTGYIIQPAGIEFACGEVLNGPDGTYPLCNGPPKCGQEKQRTQGGFYVTLTTVSGFCDHQIAYDDGSGAVAIGPDATPILSNELDCSTFLCTCRKKDGCSGALYAKFKSLNFLGNVGASPFTDDSYILVEADSPEGVGPCPDDHECTEAELAKLGGDEAVPVVTGRSAGGVLLGRPAPAVPAPVCLYFGPALTGADRNAAKLDHARDWHWCEHPGKPLGAAVCPCQGCGVNCPGYRPDV